MVDLVTFHQALTFATVYLFRRWLPRNRSRKLPGRAWRCFHGRVRIPPFRGVRLVIESLSDRWIFFILSLLGLRQWLIRIMPESLVFAVGAGIGIFIA